MSEHEFILYYAIPSAFLFNALIWGYFCSALAHAKGYSNTLHFWGGFLFEIIDMLYLIGLPNRKGEKE